MSANEVAAIIAGRCHYCGEPPRDREIWFGGGGKRGKRKRRVLATHTVDRADSLGDYTIDNVVTACVDCNMMKSNRTQDEFIKRCQAVSVYQTSRP